MTEAVALHVVVSDFDYEFGTQRLPGQGLALAPAALGARPAVVLLAGRVLSHILSRLSGGRSLAVRGEKFCQLASLLVGEARADADMLQRAGVVEKTEQE